MIENATLKTLLDDLSKQREKAEKTRDEMDEKIKEIDAIVSTLTGADAKKLPQPSFIPGNGVSGSLADVGRGLADVGITGGEDNG